MVVQDPIGLPYCDHEPRSRQAWQKSGLHPEFIKPIMDVVNIYNMIVLIRGNDPNYIGLLTDRYATKSMYLHSKTCSWGPMTGFVCFDPNFHKKSVLDNQQRESQIRCLIESMMHSKQHHKLKILSPLRITDKRLKELEDKRLIRTVNETVPRLHKVRIVEAFEPSDPIMQRKFGDSYNQISKFELEHDHVNGLWAIRYLDVGVTSEQIFNQCFDYIIHTTKDPFIYFELKPYIENLSAWIRSKNFHPRAVLGLVDPLCPYHEDDFRCATTGDYDLFAMHPLLAHYAAGISLLSRHSTTQEGVDANQIPWIRIPASTKLYQGTSQADMRRRTERRTVLTNRTTGQLITPYADKAGWARTPPPSTPSSPVQPPTSRVQGHSVRDVSLTRGASPDRSLSPDRSSSPVQGVQSRSSHPRGDLSGGSPAGALPGSSPAGGALPGSSPAGGALSGGSPAGFSTGISSGLFVGAVLNPIAISVTNATPVQSGAPNFPAAPPSSIASKPLQGVLTPREMELISELNHKIKYGGELYSHSLRLFHHGPDSHNPHGTSPDLPCIALLPCATHSSEGRVAGCVRVVYLSNARQLADFYFWNVICAGYALSPGINLKWFDRENPTPIMIFNPATDSGTEAQLPHKQILENHIAFELNLNTQGEVLVAESWNLWQQDIAPVSRRLEFPS